jgi:hypothetical protein
MCGACVLEGLLQVIGETRIHAEENTCEQGRLGVGKHVIDVIERSIFERIQRRKDGIPSVTRQNRYFGIGHV